MLDYLTEQGHMHPTFFVPPIPGYECDAPATDFNSEVVKVPRLFDSYLRIGAKVCGPPAIDRSFKTIDFLVILDSQNIDARTRRMFLGQ